ncbi:hypothetical protein N473_15725 [Pseudoalteromonas luteoviolacea CPMOR-1]|uniref:NinB protein n=1 Tax=Pseudoalteromonas luteoviolacea CPMOR-1 TaxID=1365248 RepID=A0A162BLQ7_9GAMM|nr:hypothetical protein [Pseudoalteromonas luteoviolacea]KZN64048.1 hypothetical protein N473_15725 [Pseudoalteromonas luteoviolacea CPMOR-1]
MTVKVLTFKNYVQAMPIIGSMIREMIKAKKVVRLEFKEQNTIRSTAQNRLMWKWNQAISEFLREHHGQETSSADVHEVLVRKKFGVRVVQVGVEEPIIVRKQTRKLGTKQFAEYLEWMDMYCAEYLGLMLPKPEDLYMLAVYGEGEKRVLN